MINLYGITVGESISYPNIRKETTLKNFKYKVLISILVFVAVEVLTIVLTKWDRGNGTGVRPLSHFRVLKTADCI